MSETTDPGCAGGSAEARRRAFDWFTPRRFGILLALLIFAAFPHVLLGVQTFVVRDYGFFAYPLAHFQRDCFRHGELPLWDPYNNCGVPFLAQWNTMPLYPPSLIYLLLPLPWSLSFFCLLHLWFAGFGMFSLARRWTGLRRAEVSSIIDGYNASPVSDHLSNQDAAATQAGNSFAAAFAGVAFAFNGLTLNLLMWPSHIATLSWMPWVVLAVELAWRKGGQKIILAAFAGALQMLAGSPEIIFLTWILLLALWIQQFVKRAAGVSPAELAYIEDGSGGKMPPARYNVAACWRFPLVVTLVISLAAVQLLPFLDLAAHSQRSAGYADTRWSMPGWGWVNFLVPMAFGRTWTEGVFFQNGQYWTSSYYLGISALWLALLAVWTVRERRVWLLGAVAMVALVFALGENTFVYPALRKIIPQLSLMTYPVKYVIFVALLAPLLAAFALAHQQNLRSEEKSAFNKRLVLVGAVLLALIAGILFWARQFPFSTDDVHATLLNGLSRAAFLILTGALLFVLTRENAPGLRRIAPLILIFVAWLDVFTHEPGQNPTVPPSVYELNLARARLAMQPQPALGESRAMVTPAAAMDFIRFALSDPKNNYLAKRLGYCANCNLLDAVPKVDGFFSLVPRESDGLISLLYGATNANFPKLNDFLGVSQITAPDEFFHWQARKTFLPLVTAGQKPVFRDDARTLRALAQPDFDGGKFVYLPPMNWLVPVTNRKDTHVLNSKFGRQTVDVEVETADPSLVVVAQTYYHNWHAKIDGQPTTLFRANYAFQAVLVQPGKHQIHFFYQDRAFEIGAAITICMVVNCFIFLRLLRKRQFRPQP
ncbi:MAG: YfhO family protein [Limisphaerales bacterium]